MIMGGRVVELLQSFLQLSQRCGEHELSSDLEDEMCLIVASVCHLACLSNHNIYIYTHTLYLYIRILSYILIYTYIYTYLYNYTLDFENLMAWKTDSFGRRSHVQKRPNG